MIKLVVFALTYQGTRRVALTQKLNLIANPASNIGLNLYKEHLDIKRLIQTPTLSETQKGLGKRSVIQSNPKESLSV